MTSEYEIHVVKDAYTYSNGLIWKDVHVENGLYSLPQDAILMTHDFCEHVNGLVNVGSFHDEMEAMGGLAYVRGYNEVLRLRGNGLYPFWNNVASGVARMYVSLEGKPYKAMTHTPMWSEGAEVIADVTIMGQKLIRDYLREKNMVPNDEHLARYILQMNWRMNVGWNKAKTRYNGDRETACEFFWKVYHLVDGVMNSCEFVGQRYKMIVDYPNVRVEEIYGSNG